MAVSRWFADAGLPLPASTSRGFAYCPSGVNWFRKQGRWSDKPSIGAVVFFQWPGETVAAHVGIVEAINKDGSITTIEGNTNKQGSAEGLYVMRQVRKSFILGFGVPDYAYEDETISIPNTITESEDMPKYADKFQWPNGDQVQVFPNGDVKCFGGTKFWGSMASLRDDAKKSFKEAAAIGPVDTENSQAGYTVYDQDNHGYGFKAGVEEFFAKH
jgi:hypothetical protein